MSFTVTSQSVIRFESSAKQEDELKRTLMFFNVDISGGVSCDHHRNEITASRTRLRNGKQRNPGGGLSNPISESAMSFGAPNKFYAQSRNEFDHRGSGLRPRSLGGRRNNTGYSDSRRHFYYRSVRPRRNRLDTASYSHFPAVESTDHYPDYETYNGYDEEYDNHYADESYQNEGYKTPNYPEEVEDSRDCYKSSHGYYTIERPKRDPKQASYVPEPYRNYSNYYPEELPYDDYNTDYRESSIYIPRQASGSLPPEYASSYDNNNYYSNNYKDYNNESGYDRRYEPNDYDYEERYEDSQPSPGRDHQIPYSASNRFDYEDYDERRSRSPPIPVPKPEAKLQKPYGKKVSTPYKTYKQEDYSNKQSRNFKNETEKIRDLEMSMKPRKQFYETESLPRKSSKFKDTEISNKPRKQYFETESFPRNSSKRHYQPEKAPPRKYCDHFKRIREAPEQYERISKKILNTASPKKYENNSKTKEKMPRKASAKSKYNFYVEPEIPQPYKKYIKAEVPRSHRNYKINDEIPRRQRNSVKEPSVLPSKKYNHHEGRSYRKSSPDKKKSVDFGSEIPYRIRKSAAASSVFFSIDIPYKKKERKRCYVPRRSDSGCDTGPQHSNSACRLRKEPSLRGCGIQPSFKPRTSLYDLEKHRQRKTMRQKISGFFKKSKMCLKRSNIFRDKSKKYKTCQPCQRLLSNPQVCCRDNVKTHSAMNSPKASNHCFLVRNKMNPACGPRGSILTQPNPSLENASQRCSRKGIGCHYPTVYRGKCKEVDDETQQYSMYNLLGSMHRSKCDHCDRGLRNRTSEYSRHSKMCNRISSGNCSLYDDEKKKEPIKPSEINVCLTIRGTDVSLTGSPRIISSKAISSQGKGSSESADPEALRQVSGSSTCGSCSSAYKENHFKNVRFSPTPSICTSISSRTQRTNRSNRKSIVACSKPPRLSRSRSSEGSPSCPRHRIGTKWSLTRQSCAHRANQRTKHTWSPDKLESNCSRPPRPGLCLPNNIEMCSKPPTMIQCDLNKRSSLKGVNNCPEKTSNKRVCLNTNSSSSCPSNISSGTCSKNSDKSQCCKEKRDIDCMEKPKCQRPQLGLRRTCSWPSQNPRSCPPRRTRSYCLPKVLNKSSGSSMSKCSRSSSQRNSRNCPENMQLVCLPDPTCATCSTGPQTEYTASYTASPCRDSTGSNPRGDLCCPKLVTDWERESCCRRSIVEELKRELLQTFRTEQQIESQSHCLRPTPHIMIFPCVPENICQPAPNMNSNTFCRPESVVCWAACSKPPIPF